MGQCLYNTWRDGCSMYDKNEKYDLDNELSIHYGFDKEGHCVVEDDEFPEGSCQCYESNEDEEES